MLGWLFNILVGQFCFHKWEVIQHGEITIDGNPTGTYYNLRCTKCGNIKCTKT